jgi:DNA-directed RNA polymerase specialized sigma24 family protein
LGQRYSDPISTDVLDVHAALEEFARIAPRQAELVELHFFGGLSLEEAGKVIGVSPRMADKDWALARAWLRRRLAHGSEEPQLKKQIPAG